MNPLVSVREFEGVAVATLEGEIDLACTATLARRVFQLMSSDSVGLVLDLAGVRYVDSSGIRMIFDMARQLLDGRRHLALSVPAGSSLHRLFEVTRVGDAAPVFPSVDEARAAVRARAAEVAESPGQN